MKHLSIYLINAGTLPFIGCALLLLLGVRSLPWLGDVLAVLQGYTMVIVAFMAGVHWGQHLHVSGAMARWLPIISNGCAVVVWLSFVVLPAGYDLAVAMVVFGVVLATDMWLWRGGVIALGYWRCRCFATLVVVATLLVAIVSL